MKKYTSIIIYSIVLVLFTACIASGATMIVMSANKLNEGETVTVSMEEYQQMQQYKKLSLLKSTIDRYYINDYSEQDIYDGAAYGMVAMLQDPYSFYLNPEDMQALEEDQSGEYVGIGGTFLMDPNEGYMVITRIYPDSPLAASGAQIGDKLYAINDEIVYGKDQNTISTLIRGDEGTQVTVTLMRDNERHDYTMTRQKVDVVDMDHRMINDNILYIKLSAFSTHSDTAFVEALEEGKRQKMQALIIDLRSNGGGGGDILKNIADPLLPEGTIFYTEDKEGQRNYVNSDARCLNLPIVVLCDGNTASSSELLIAALQDYQLATIVGTKTFGKAVGQSTISIGGDGSGIYPTTVRAYSPNGRNWHGTGLEPDVTVELPDELMGNPLLLTDENDLQLQEALKILGQKIGDSQE